MGFIPGAVVRMQWHCGKANVTKEVSVFQVFRYYRIEIIPVLFKLHLTRIQRDSEMHTYTQWAAVSTHLSEMIEEVHSRDHSFDPAGISISMKVIQGQE